MRPRQILFFIRTLKFILKHPLNQSHKLAATWRYFRWQIGRRIVPDDVLLQWIDDSKLVIGPGDTVAAGCAYSGLIEFEDMAFVLHLTRDDDYFVDVGANVGVFTVLACAARGARGLAFEPGQGAFKRLSQNIALNNLGDRVELLNVAVGNENGTVSFVTGNNATNHVATDSQESQARATTTVPIRKLDSVIDSQHPTILKIDVEGLEAAVIAGASRILADPALDAIIVELRGHGNQYGYSESETFDTLLTLGFRAYRYDPFSRKLHEISSINDATGNTLFIRNIERVKSRLTGAAKITLNGVTF